jgi:hypothetical protein
MAVFFLNEAKDLPFSLNEGKDGCFLTLFPLSIYYGLPSESAVVLACAEPIICIWSSIIIDKQ